MTKENKCMFPGCRMGIFARGLCEAHYLACRRLVIHGDTTWKKLEEAGRCRPIKTRHDTRNSKWFLEGVK